MGPKKKHQQQKQKSTAKTQSSSSSSAGPRLQISAENENRLRRLLLNSGRTGHSAPAGPPVEESLSKAQKAKKLKTIYEKLSCEGFTNHQIELALSALKVPFSIICSPIVHFRQILQLIFIDNLSKFFQWLWFFLASNFELSWLFCCIEQEGATFEASLDWLCLNLPSNELPLKFSSGTSQHLDGKRIIIRCFKWLVLVVWFKVDLEFWTKICY